MSALPPKADIAESDWNVRFVPKADSCGAAKVAGARLNLAAFRPKTHDDIQTIAGADMRRVSSIILFSLALAGLAVPVASEAQIICTGNASPPPELPDYEQPPIPEPGYIWAPGYWGIGPSGYYWVPGTWVLPPAVGLLWTPGYWGWRDGIYVWNAGYWGPHVGFYGGVNYGFGYGGVGYEGGRWDNGVFAYNRTVNNFGNVTINHVYEKTVIVEPGATRVSFNGGSGGTTVRPTPEQIATAGEKHVAAVPSQLQQERTASENKALLASENHGKPAIAATAKPGEFSGHGVVAAKETIGTNPTGAKTFEERGMGAGPSGTNPGGSKSATNPTGAKTFEERGIGTGPSGTNPGGSTSATNPTGAVGTGPSGSNPGGAKSATNPTGARTFEERGVDTGPSGSNPGGAKSATNPTGARTFEERGIGTGPSGTNPGSAKSATSPTGAKTFEERGMGAGPSGPNPNSMGTSNQRGMGGERATLNGGNAPRMPNTGAPPLQPVPHAGGMPNAGGPPLQSMPHASGMPNAGAPPQQSMPHAGGPPPHPQGGGGQQQNNKDKDH
jgi:hypothetical protein